ncbi:L-glyceraldehyde 3-phosphate reductase [Actinoplanes rectilineatus]|uniref:L-glyceraldehyde 3-phosphate reductase n=1 Tax=Actinoplanes rectilineatus TaxID=113571 RepID=UPI0012F856D6|nr:L-glyceraldehyde 3-phosphate reductase [Actinoplanes rectilineatus]GLY03101.1 glyceraldehyde 3-phosphate reductase [Actinoplanes sp. NBRC 101535]
MTYNPDSTRYDSMEYRRAGRSGLKLPAISLGLWHNFGDTRPLDRQREIVRRAFDLGVTHFDLANNYGPPPGSAESNFGRLLATDLKAYRDEIIVSTKAGYVMWDGPYGDFGSRKYLVSSLDQSLGRLGLDYVDIFYHHRPDPETPLEETAAALDHIVRSGKALYVGISNYKSAQAAEIARLLRDLGTPLLIHQPSYSILNRWIEHDNLLDTLEEAGAGAIAFSPLQQGLLTDRYLTGIPDDSRIRTSHFLNEEALDAKTMGRLHALNDIAQRRGQSLAQLALSWALRDPRMTSLIIGASSVGQLENNIAALSGPKLDKAEIDEIDATVLDL